MKLKQAASHLSFGIPLRALGCHCEILFSAADGIAAVAVLSSEDFAETSLHFLIQSQGLHTDPSALCCSCVLWRLCECLCTCTEPVSGFAHRSTIGWVCAFVIDWWASYCV